MDAAELARCNLLVVSDLHLSEGRDPQSKRFSRNEDFYFDEAFASFLGWYQRDPRWAGVCWHLVINGDFLDLLQVVTEVGAPPSLRRSSQPRFGLVCGERESAYKLERIAEGHWLFFEALAAFLEAGHQVTVIRGNHDVELHYPMVQQALTAALQAAGQRVRAAASPAGPPPAAAPAIATNLRFSDWFHYEPGQVWIEHGNRYDSLNSFVRWLAPLLPQTPGRPPVRQDEIDLPLGSLFVRYLFNSIETAEPFADNIKPASKFISWIFMRHPFTALRFAFGDGRLLLDRIRRAWRPPHAGAYATRDREHQLRLASLAGTSGIPQPVLEALDGLAAPSLLRRPSGFWLGVLRVLVMAQLLLPLLGLAVAAAVATALLAVARLVALGLPAAWPHGLGGLMPGWEGELGGWALLVLLGGGSVALLAYWTRRRRAIAGPSYLKERAARIAELLGIRYVVMGHTHDAELYDIGTPTSPPREYFNTGTWTKVFSEEERLLRDDLELVFLEGVRAQGALRMRLLEWSQGAAVPTLVPLFRDE